MNQGPLFPEDLNDFVEKCNVSDHLCSFYEDEEERNTLVSYFILVGLEKGQWVIFFDHSDDHSSIVRALQKLSIDVDSAIASGQLKIEDANSYYLPSGSFDSKDVILQLQNLDIRASVGRWNGLRFAADIPFAVADSSTVRWLDPEPIMDKFVRYESEVNKLFPKSSTLALCLYKRSVFPEKALANILCAHPLVVQNKKVLRNKDYLPPPDWNETYPINAKLEDLLNKLKQSH